MASRPLSAQPLSFKCGKKKPRLPWTGLGDRDQVTGYVEVSLLTRSGTRNPLSLWESSIHPLSPSQLQNHASTVWSRPWETAKHQSRRSLYFCHPHLHLGRSEIAAGGTPKPTQAATECDSHPGLVEGQTRGSRSSGPTPAHIGRGSDRN